LARLRTVWHVGCILKEVFGGRNDAIANKLLGDLNMTGTSIKSILAFALLVGVASQANADIWGHIDRQANDIERATKLLRSEVDHYRHTRYFGQLIGATARLKGQAIHVHNIADHSQCPKALKIAVRELDRAFHDAEDLFDRVEHNAAYGDGCVKGNTAHVKRLLNNIEDCIHNLRDDLARLTRVQTRTRVDVYRPPVEVIRTQVPRHPAYNINRGYGGYGGYGSGYSRPAYGGRSINIQSYDRGRSYYGHGYNRSARGSGFGISIGGGSSRFTFNF